MLDALRSQSGLEAIFSQKARDFAKGCGGYADVDKHVAIGSRPSV